MLHSTESLLEILIHKYIQSEESQRNLNSSLRLKIARSSVSLYMSDSRRNVDRVKCCMMSPLKLINRNEENSATEHMIIVT